jgi:molybdopterin-guanine dinucleotide biosynthesis protein A
MDVLILAGGKTKDALFQATNVGCKAFIKIKDKTMLEWVVDAFKDTGFVERMIVLGDPDELKKLKMDAEILPEGESLMDNVERGLKAMDSSKQVVISTCDVPLVTAPMLKALLAEFSASGADVVYPIVPKEQCVKKYPTVKRTYAKMREGTFTGGNVFYCKQKVLKDNFDLLRKLVQNRKNPVALGQVLGMDVLWKFLTGKASLDFLTARVSSVVNANVRPLVCKDPEIGFDVDKPSDLVIVKKVLES